MIKFLLCILISFGYMQSQELPTGQDNNNFLHTDVPIGIENELNSFYNLLAEKKYDNAFDFLFKNYSNENKKQSINSLKTEYKKTVELFGELKNFDKVKTERIGKSMLRLTYLGLHDKYPSRWTFSYYKSPTKNWILINTQFDLFTELLFDE